MSRQATQARPPITLEDIQRAKAVLARAEAALGVAQPKAKVMPVPTHPQHLEDPALGDKTPPVVEWYLNNDPEEREIKTVKWELEKDVEEPVDSTTTPHRIWLTQRSALLVSKVLSIVAE
jgi:hypothetical protein